jgi:DNA helicase-2/ATP-dependent DNA helicase PcrA
VEHGVRDNACAPSVPLLVIAGAGSGKTNTLAHRVAHLVVNGADPRRILLMTFSRRASGEMARRVERICSQVLGANAGIMTDALAWAGTFHGIGARLLREYAEQIGLDPAFTIHDREDSADLMNLLRHQLGLSKNESRFPTKGTCLAIYSRAVNAQLALGEVLGGVYPWCAGWEIRLRELFALYVEAATGATSRMKLKLSFSYSVALMASFEPDKSSVYPSAGACTTASTAIVLRPGFETPG